MPGGRLKPAGVAAGVEAGHVGGVVAVDAGQVAGVVGHEVATLGPAAGVAVSVVRCGHVVKSVAGLAGDCGRHVRRRAEPYGTGVGVGDRGQAGGLAACLPACVRHRRPAAAAGRAGVVAGLLGLGLQLPGYGRVAAAATGLGGADDAPQFNVAAHAAVVVPELDRYAAAWAERAA